MHDGKEDIMRKTRKYRAKRGLAAFMLVIMTALILSGASSVWTAESASAAETGLQDGTYAVPVNLLNESQDKASMADNALNHEGKLVISGGEATLCMNLVSIKSSGLEGHLMQFDVLKDVQLENGVPKKYSTQSSKTVSTYSVTDDYNKSGSPDRICAGKKYPKVVSIPVDLTQDFTWVHMYIPVMGSLGFGDQLARLKVDVSQAKAMTRVQLSSWQKLETSDGSSDPGKTDPGKNDPGKNSGDSGKNTTDGKTGAGKLDKNKLADGKYTVTVHLWHATQNRESMGNATLNHQALITVKKDVYTMDITTHPVKIGSVTACLQSLWIKQSGGYTAAAVKARNNAGGQPSVFSFRLPSKDQYIPAKIDPRVEVMGSDPIDARLRISWDTLKRASSGATVKENTSTTNSSVSGSLSSGSGSGLTGSGALAAEDMPEEDMTSADGTSPLTSGTVNTGDVVTTQSMMAMMLVGVSMIASLAMVIVVMVTMIRLAGRRVH